MNEEYVSGHRRKPSYQGSIDDRQQAVVQIVRTIEAKQRELQALQKQITCLREACDLVATTS